MNWKQTALYARLPELRRVEKLEVEPGEVLVHAPGFEDRTLGILDAVRGCVGLRCILLDYRPFDRGNRLQEVRGRLVEAGADCVDGDVLTYDRFCPGDFEVRLRDRLRNFRPKRITIDISTMSKLAIMLTLGVCGRMGARVRVVYAEAETYGPSLEEFEAAREREEIHRPSLQVFDGVHGVVRVASLASVAMQGQPTAALVFMSFNNALTQVLLNTVYPSRLLLINSRPPIQSWREEAIAWIHEEVRREWSEDNALVERDDGTLMPRRTVSTLDYRESVELLVDEYWKLSEAHRIVLAPAGSKMQTVGCWLAKALHPDIHVEYPSPEGFQKEYSSGMAQRWCIELGVVEALLGDLAREERRKYLEIGLI